MDTPAVVERLRKWASAKNAAAFVLVVTMVAISLKTRGPQVHGHICFFADEACDAAARATQAPVEDDQGAAAAALAAAEAASEEEAHVCAMRDLLKLVACKSGKFDDNCCKGYRHFMRANCVCAYDAWPRQYVGDDMTPMIWAQNIMQCNVSYAQIAYSAPCLEQPITCPADADNDDISLSSHPRGLVLFRRDGEWGRVRGFGMSYEIADSTCQRLGYARALGYSTSTDAAETYELVPDDKGDGENDPAGETDELGRTLALGVPAHAHMLSCADNDRDLTHCARLGGGPLGGIRWGARQLQATPVGRRAAEEDEEAAEQVEDEADSRRRARAERAARRHAAAEAAEEEEEDQDGRRNRRHSNDDEADLSAAAGDDAGPVDGDGAWVVECTRLPAEGAEKLPGPQACWRNEDDTATDCSGDRTSASVACGSSDRVEG